nr:transposase (putative), gypsy type [Tanacetum cinerariifolium]
MGRDTIQLENAVSTISQEYLLEFTFEYGIPESLHPKLPGPEDPIVEFPEGKIGVYTKFFEFANFRIPILQFLFDILGHYQIHLSQLSVIGAAKVDEKVFPTIVDWCTNAPKDEMPFADSYSAVAVATLNIRHMDLFNLISAPNPTKVETGTRPRAAHEVPLLTATASRVIDMGDTAVASGSSETHVAIEKSPLYFADEDPTLVITEKGDEATTEAILESGPEKEAVAMGPVVKYTWGKSLATIEIEADFTGFAPATQETPVNVSDPDPLLYEEPRPITEQHIAQSFRRTPVAEDPDSKKSTSFTSMVGSPESIYQPGWGRIEAREKHIKNLEALLEAEADMKVSTLQAQMSGEERIKAAFEEFKKCEDDRVTSRCAKMDARLDALSIDFDEELYPHMLIAIAGRRWVIRRGLRLAIMKCAESTELRQVFVDVVSAGIAKGMSEGIKHGVEHGKAKVDLAAIEAYDPEADTKYIAALYVLKDLKYPLVDQLEKLKDAPIDVRNPKDAWSFKEEILLEDVIAANISHAEKKKKFRVVCCTHEVGFAYHARSDGVPISVPTVAPQGLAILLADAATQTDRTEDEASPRLLRSKFVPPMYNLDWR